MQAIYCGCNPLLPRRLAYPEHLPAASQAHCLYDDFDGLLQRLRILLQVPERAASGLRSHVARYDWGRLISKYDNLLENVRTGIRPGEDP